MKILEIIPQLSSGGAERFVVDLCNELISAHEVVLVVLFPLDQCGFLASEVNSQVRLVCLNKRKGLDFGVLYRLHRLIRKERPQVVHSHLRAISYIFPAAFLFGGIVFLHTIHSDANVEAGGRIGKFLRCILFASKRVHPVTISPESQQSFCNVYHVPSHLIVNGRPSYLPTATLSEARKSIDGLRINKDSVVLINVARIAWMKNQLRLAKAVDNLSRKGVNIELLIIGNCQDQTIYEAIKNLRCPRIHLLGECGNPRDYMEVCKVFCLPSIVEGMPITLIECFSVGAVPICTSVGGVSNMINDGENGVLVHGTAQQDIEDGIMRFLNMTEGEIQRMSRRSKDSFELYKMNLCAERYICLMSSLSKNS